MKEGELLPNLGGQEGLGLVHSTEVRPQSHLHPEECVVHIRGFTFGLGTPALGVPMSEFSSDGFRRPQNLLQIGYHQ